MTRIQKKSKETKGRSAVCKLANKTSGKTLDLAAHRTNNNATHSNSRPPGTCREAVCFGRTATPSGETIMPTAPLMSSQRRFLQIIAKNAAGVQQLLHPNVSPRLQGSQTPENTKGFSESKPCDTTCDQILSLLLAGRRRRWDRTPPTSLR